MSTLGNEASREVRQALRKMRLLALAFHGSELRLLDRTERRAKVVTAAPVRLEREKERVGV